jgi:hypothetical protein
MSKLWCLGSLILQINRSSIARIVNQYRGNKSIENMPLEFWKNPFQTHLMTSIKTNSHFLRHVLGISLGLSWAIVIGNFDITPFSKKKRERENQVKVKLC